MSDAFKKAYEEGKKKVKDQQGQSPAAGKIKTPWDDSISPEEQARNNSTTRPDDK